MIYHFKFKMQVKTDFKEFQLELSRRGIEHLIHFTPTINLLSIFEQGKILSRALLEKFDIAQTDIFDYVEFTDNFRYDDKSYINLSVQSPNNFLFSRFRQKTADQAHITWCILKIDCKYVYEKNTLFSVTNAANSHNNKNVGITGDISKFRMLFAPSLTVVTSYGSRPVHRGNLKSKYPTDEQAEVLVKDEIPIEDILQICFKDNSDLASGKAAFNQFDTSKFVVDSALFSNSRI